MAACRLPSDIRHTGRLLRQFVGRELGLDVHTRGIDPGQRGDGQSLAVSPMMRTLIALIVFSLCGCAGEAPGSSGGARLSVATETPDQVEAGRRIVEFQCTSCHGVRTDDKSHNPRAPALRTLAERYPVTGLEEAFANGIMIGHPGMPEFRFDRDQIKAILAYLESIQTRQAASLEARRL